MSREGSGASMAAEKASMTQLSNVVFEFRGTSSHLAGKMLATPHPAALHQPSAIDPLVRVRLIFSRS